MRKTVRYAPPYSLAFISGPKFGRPPDPFLRKFGEVLATPTCISFGVYMAQEKPTTFTLGDFREVMPQRVPQQPPVFDGVLETPEQRVVVSTAESVIFMDMPVRTKTTRVRIWTNHPNEPDEVIIGVE